MFHDGFSSDIASAPQDIRSIRDRGVSGSLPHCTRPTMCRSDLRVLVVEDEAVIGILIEDILLDLGCGCVDLASSVEGALGVLEDASPDFAFLDINLSGRKSYPVADVLKARGIPFVFVSAYSTHGLDTVHACTKILQKPFLPRDLDLALDRAFPSLHPVVRAA
jgi:CheY-like chemotaxis protein